MLSLSLVIPAYNESQGIKKCLLENYAKLSQLLDDFEIIVVDDASTDGTYEAACQLKKQEGLTKLKIVQNTKNNGQGASLKRGLDLSQKNILVHNSVDMPFAHHDWPKLLENMQDADMLVVERINRDNYGLYRKVISYGLVFLLNFLFSLKFSDYSFIQAFKKETYQQCAQPQVKGTALFMPSLIISSFKTGLNVKTMKAKFNAREVGKASGASFKNIILGLYELVLLRLGAHF